MGHGEGRAIGKRGRVRSVYLTHSASLPAKGSRLVEGEPAVQLDCGGYYLNQASWEIQAIHRKGGVLQGPKESSYIRLPVHPVLMPFVGALFGGLFVVLAPLIAIPSLLWLLTVKLWKKFAVAKERLLNGRRKA